MSAQSLLGALGGDAVALRLPVAPAGNSDAEELGMPSPEYRDVVLRPALVRHQGPATTVLVDAAAVEAALGPVEVETALRAASFVQVGGTRFYLTGVERRAVFGRAYLYRMLLQAAESLGAA